MNYKLREPLAGPTPQYRKPIKIPFWAILIIWATAAFVGIVFLGQLKNEEGNRVLNTDTVTLLVSLMALFGALLTQILQKQNAIDHENHPNSGSTHRDATNRIERKVDEALQVAKEAALSAIRAEKAAEESKKDAQETRDDVQQLHSDVSQIRTDLSATNTAANKIIHIFREGNLDHA